MEIGPDGLVGGRRAGANIEDCTCPQILALTAIRPLQKLLTGVLLLAGRQAELMPLLESVRRGRVNEDREEGRTGKAGETASRSRNSLLLLSKAVSPVSADPEAVHCPHPSSSTLLEVEFWPL